MSGESDGSALTAGTADTGEQLLAGALVVGGVIGILVAASAISSPGGISPFTPIVVLSLATFGASVWTGWALWRGHPRGRDLATALFALQIPYVSAAGLTYQFFTVAALRIAVVFDGELSGSVEFGAFFALVLNSVPGGGYVGVNVLAIGAVWYLLRAR